jgi:ABC-type sulfate/molybdate transport systems ATPase subunit
LGKLLNRYPHQLSGGEQQRAALLRALVAEKPILLLDEALSQIDRPHRLSLYRKLQDTLRPEQLLLFSTHQWEDAEQFAEHVVFLKQGRIASSSHVTQTVPVDSEMAFMMGYVGSVPVSDGHLLIHPRTIFAGQNRELPVHIAGEGHQHPISATLSRYHFRSTDGGLLLEWIGNPATTPEHFHEISISNPVQVPFALPNTQGGE